MKPSSSVILADIDDLYTDKLWNNCHSDPFEHFARVDSAVLMQLIEEIGSLKGQITIPNGKSERIPTPKSSPIQTPSKPNIKKRDGVVLLQSPKKVNSVATTRGESSIEKIPKIPVTEGCLSPVQVIKGPGESSLTSICYGTYASANASSSYPLIPARPNREGDPICDRYYLSLFETRVIICLADGCNWGHRSRKAAKRASKRFVEFITQFNSKIVTPQIAASVLLLGFSEAHKRILQRKGMEDLEPGSTTLIGGILLQIDHNSEFMLRHEQAKAYKWIFVFVNLGDCKFYNYSPLTRRVSDLTPGNRVNVFDSTDPGGRLGGFPQPDVRNLRVDFAFVSEGDYIFAVSDGVHDNFDPQIQGLTPRDCNIPYDCWEDIPDKSEVIRIKTMHQEKEISKAIQEGGGTITPEIVVKRLLAETEKITTKLRKYMEENPLQNLPENFQLYPGKLDHTSCVCFVVNGICKSDDFVMEPTVWKSTSTPQLIIGRKNFLGK